MGNIENAKNLNKLLKSEATATLPPLAITTLKSSTGIFLRSYQSQDKYKREIDSESLPQKR